MELDFDSRNFSLDSLLGHIVPHLDKRDRRLVDWLIFGMNENNLNSHFYRTISRSKSRFLKEYFHFDLIIRNILAADIAYKTQQNPETFMISMGEMTDQLLKNKSGVSAAAGELEYGARFLQILENPNIIEKEQLIDQLRWEKAGEICTYNYFDIDVILSFLLKSGLVQRWALMDKAKGEKMFRELVSEIKGNGLQNKEQ